KVKGMFVRPEQIAEIGARNSSVGKLRLVVTREGDQDAMELQAEATGADDALGEKLTADLQAVTKLRGRVRFVAPGALPNDGKVIADDRDFEQ
ncbi:MAG: phenylacetate--CoA ligase family protein, partial [Pseudomonadota bacterium]